MLFAAIAVITMIYEEGGVFCFPPKDYMLDLSFRNANIMSLMFYRTPWLRVGRVIMAHETGGLLICFEEKLLKIGGIYSILWVPLT
jgi:hypothetical protein